MQIKQSSTQIIEGKGNSSFSSALWIVSSALFSVYLARSVLLFIVILPVMLFVVFLAIMLYHSNIDSSPSSSNNNFDLTQHIVSSNDLIKKGQKISIVDFYLLYFNQKIHLGKEVDLLELLESRHLWAKFNIGYHQLHFFIFKFLKSVLVSHFVTDDKADVETNYNRTSIYQYFLGESMIYTSGMLTNNQENEHSSLEEMQINKLKVVCDKLQLKQGESLLDMGCGWGTLALYAAQNYKVKPVGVSLSSEQIAYCNNKLDQKKKDHSSMDVKFVCADARDMLKNTKYNKISCLEMSEHIGVLRYSSFIGQIYNALEDDGIFFLQIAGLRQKWQYEDLVWGMFMNEYIFPGADASMPLNWVINKLESNGFEIASVETIGVHYSATIWRWYNNIKLNKDHIIEQIGVETYRIFEFFLAWSTIISRQGSASCYQIVCHKNLNGFNRARFVKNIE